VVHVKFTLEFTIAITSLFRTDITLSATTHQHIVVKHRLGLAIVPLCLGTGAPFDEHVGAPLETVKYFESTGGGVTDDIRMKKISAQFTRTPSKQSLGKAERMRVVG